MTAISRPPASSAGAQSTKAPARDAQAPRRDAKTGRSRDTDEIARRLRAAIPEPRCELAHGDAWELLVATILSAQSTDRRVNAVTPELFRRWPTPRALADAPQAEVEAVVRSTGFFRNKAKAIRGAARKVADDFAGRVPRTLEEAITLPGVARKTANLVLGTAYGLAVGMVVDTHVGRVARRLGWTGSDDPVAVERDLCARFPRKDWIAAGHRLLLHGRYICAARAPRCAACPLNELCPGRTEPSSGTWQERCRAEAERIAELAPPPAV